MKTKLSSRTTFQKQSKFVQQHICSGLLWVVNVMKLLGIIVMKCSFCLCERRKPKAWPSFYPQKQYWPCPHFHRFSCPSLYWKMQNVGRSSSGIRTIHIQGIDYYEVGISRIGYIFLIFLFKIFKFYILTSIRPPSPSPALPSSPLPLHPTPVHS